MSRKEKTGDSLPAEQEITVDEYREGRYINWGKGETWAALSAVSMATMTVLLKWSLVNVNSVFASILRIMPAWLIIVFLVARDGTYKRLWFRNKEFIGWKALGLNTLSAASFNVFANIFFFKALSSGTVMLISPLKATQVIWVALLAMIFLGERLNFKMVLGMILSIFGVWLLQYGEAAGITLTGNLFWAIFGGLMSAMFFATGNVIQKYLFSKGNIPMRLIMFWNMTFGLVALHIILLSQGLINLYVAYPPAILSKLLLATSLGAVAIITDANAMTHSSVSRVNVIKTTNSALAPLLALIILGEKLSVYSLLGIIIVIASAMYVQIKMGAREENVM